MIAYRLPPFVHLVAVVIIACLLSILLPGCDTTTEWSNAAVDAVPATPEQIEQVAETLDTVGVFVPDPGGWMVAAATSALGLLAWAMKRRIARKALLTREGAREVIRSVDAVLDRLPFDEKQATKQVLAAKQGDRGKALVAEVRGAVPA